MNKQDGIMQTFIFLHSLFQKSSDFLFCEFYLHSPRSFLLFIVSPHPDDLYDFILFVNLIDNPVLDIDSSRIGTFEITDEKGGVLGVLRFSVTD